jgi:hypothetical protein
LVIALVLAGVQAFAQQQSQETSVNLTNAVVHDDTRVLAPMIEDTKPTRDVIVKKNVEVSGPLVRPFTVRRITEVPKRLLQLINPFAASEHKDGLETTRGLSARAWSSTVGWHPGGSAFSDPMTHEPSMSLITFSKAPKD